MVASNWYDEVHMAPVGGCLTVLQLQLWPHSYLITGGSRMVSLRSVIRQNIILSPGQGKGGVGGGILVFLVCTPAAKIPPLCTRN